MCGSWCRSSDVLSVCLCCVLNINRAEKCPEWNEFVAAWSLSFLMMVISRVEEGNTLLLCGTAEKTDDCVWCCLIFSSVSMPYLGWHVWVGYEFAFLWAGWERCGWIMLALHLLHRTHLTHLKLPCGGFIVNKWLALTPQCGPLKGMRTCWTYSKRKRQEEMLFHLPPGGSCIHY